MASCVTAVHVGGGKCKVKSKRKKLKPDEVLRSTFEKEHYQRVARILMSGGTDLLRETFDQLCPPADLPKLLRNPATKKKLRKTKKLTKRQWDCLYPSPGVYGESTDFDVTLLFLLLRTICNLTPPPLGWDDLPPSRDHSLEADLARIKYYRNAMCHDQSMALKEEEFLHYWEEISNSLIRIAGSISPPKEREWQTTIENFKKEPLTAEHERDVVELQRWYKEGTEVKEFIEKSTVRTLQNIEEGLEELKIMLKECLEKCLVCGETTCSQDDHKGVALLKLKIDAITQPDVRRESLRMEGEGNRTPQDLLNLVAERYLQKIDPSTPEEFQDFLEYLKDVRKLLFVDAQEGSLIITVGCRSVQILEDLWKDYCAGRVNELAQKYLVTEEILSELGLTEAKLTTSISEEEYRSCQEQLLLYSELEQKLKQVKSLRDELQEQFLTWARERKSNVALLTDFVTQLRSFPLGAMEALAIAGGIIAVPFTLGMSMLFGAAAGAGARATLNKWNMQSRTTEAIVQDRKVFQELQSKADYLKQCVADLAIFCRKHTEPVLSSRHMEGEFHGLRDMLRKQEVEVPVLRLALPVFIQEEVNVHFTRLCHSLEQLRQASANEGILTIIGGILDELHEGPEDEEIRTMIVNFVEKEFAMSFFQV